MSDTDHTDKGVEKVKDVDGVTSAGVNRQTVLNKLMDEAIDQVMAGITEPVDIPSGADFRHVGAPQCRYALKVCLRCVLNYH